MIMQPRYCNFLFFVFPNKKINLFLILIYRKQIFVKGVKKSKMIAIGLMSYIYKTLYFSRGLYTFYIHQMLQFFCIHVLYQHIFSLNNVEWSVSSLTKTLKL